MDLDELRGYAGAAAGVLTAAYIGSLVALRKFLGAKQDLRDDGMRKREHTTWDAIVKGLQDEVHRLSERCAQMSDSIGLVSNDLRKERAARMEAEELAVAAHHDHEDCLRKHQQCMAKVQAFETRVAALEARDKP